MRCPQRLRHEECVALLRKFLKSAPGLECERVFKFLVLGFWVLLVKDHILLVPLIYAPDTVFASVTISEEDTLGTIATVLTKPERMRADAVNALVASLALVAHRAVHEILRFLEEIRVVGVLAIIAFADQIAVLQVPRAIIKITILHCARCIKEREVRNRVQQFLKLQEERTTEIDVFAIRQSVPPIPKPSLDAVDRKRLIGVVLRNYLLTGEIALAVVKTARITLAEPALQSTVRTGPRRRHLKLPEETLVF